MFIPDVKIHTGHMVGEVKFKDLVVLLYGVNASGLCAFNTVERPMAPLSHDNAGVLLRHNSFGNHLGEWKNY